MLGDERWMELVRQAVGRRPIRVREVVVRPGAGNTQARRVIAEFKDESTAFVKSAHDPQTVGWLRTEHLVYSAIEGAFMPRLVGWSDTGDDAALAIEDLSDGHWPPPWRRGDTEAVVTALERVRTTRPPPDLPALETQRADLDRWPLVAADPAPFLSLGLCTPDWVDAHLDALMAATDGAVLDGDELLHVDVRSDNLCLRGGRAVLVDWNWASRGNAALDAVAWAPSVTAEGGPAPEELVPHETGALAALAAGFLAGSAGQPPVPGAPYVRRLQLDLLRVALPWACRLLGIARPEPVAGPKA